MTVSWRARNAELWCFLCCSALLAICAGNSPVTGEFPAQGQWRGALMFSSMCAWINGWVNNGEAVDLRRHRVNYDTTALPEFCLKMRGTCSTNKRPINGRNSAWRGKLIRPGGFTIISPIKLELNATSSLSTNASKLKKCDVQGQSHGPIQLRWRGRKEQNWSKLKSVGHILWKILTS